MPIALSFGVSNEHTETRFVTVTLKGPFNDSGKTSTHDWRVVQCGKPYSCTVTELNRSRQSYMSSFVMTTITLCSVLHQWLNAKDLCYCQNRAYVVVI